MQGDRQADHDLLQDAMAQIQELTLRVQTLQQRREETKLHDSVAKHVPRNLQLRSGLTTAERKALLSDNKYEEFPSPLNDDNKLVGKMVSGQLKEVVTGTIPTMQKRELDIVKLAVGAWDYALRDGEDMDQRIHILSETVRTLALLSIDNAQYMAKRQLEIVLDSADAKGAYSLLRMDAGTETDVDVSSNCILQPTYVEAIQDYRKISKAIEQPKKSTSRNGGHGGRGGGFSRGGGGFNRRGGRGHHFSQQRNQYRNYDGFRNNNGGSRGYNGNSSQGQGNGRGGADQ